MNEEDYSSESDQSDEDYRPGGEESVSEVHSSGDDSDAEIEQSTKSAPKKRKSGKERIRSAKRGRMNESADSEDDTDKTIEERASGSDDDDNENEKKRADSLWADFLKDTGSEEDVSRSKEKTVVSTEPASVSKESKTNLPASSENPQEKKLTVKEIFEFAGEQIEVEKEIDATSEECNTKAQNKSGNVSELQARRPNIPSNPKRSGGLSAVLGQIGKPTKISTLQKTKLDWDKFKSSEGITEELTSHNRGKDGYLERQDFLERTDLRQFEIEKSLRLKSRSTR